MHFKSAIPALLSLIATPVLAWEHPTTPDGACVVYQTFEGEGSTTFSLMQSKELFDAQVYVVWISNENWSIKKTDKPTYTIRIEDLESGSYFSNVPNPVENGLVIDIEEKNASYVFDDTPINIAVKKNGVIIDRLNFTGFTSAYAKFNGCRSEWLKERAAKEAALAEQKRQEHLRKTIPRDPFAPAPAPKPKPKPKRTP